MDILLVVVTGVSLTLAIVMGALLARTMREEQRRSDARVQLLGELAGSDRPGRAQAPTALGDIEIRPRPAAPQAAVTGVQDLFHEHDEPSAWPRRFAVIGTMGALLFLAIAGYREIRSTSDETAPQTSAQAAAPKAPARTDAAPLELVALRHGQEAGVLTVSGLVQNPRAGTTLSKVSATLFVFGPGGSFIASGRAPLDFTSLAPGDESPFVIHVPVTGSVERYRVGFRGDDDRMLAHVDRRSPDAVAQK